MNKRLIMLAILDGWGINDNENANAVKIANTPNLDAMFKQYPNTKILTSGLDVGLPDGQMGNSEVGHTNIGAGRIVYQELTRITKSIKDGDFFENKAFLDAIKYCKKQDSDYIYMDFYQMVVYIAIIRIYMHFLNYVKKKILIEFTFIVF